ncbi:helix-turn-helix domain-containing protein [Nocardiopsis sp. NPDC049922]|uniref:helix-turn-helix domain-containing protein n=1 Tax=Nocardiopsis sp. NPDC049922 TaxID=3155157 RepID=UPI0033C2BE80
MIAHEDPRRRWYTRAEAAAEAGVSVRTVQRWVLDGRLAERHGHVNAAELFEVERERRAARTCPSPGCAA